MRNRDEVLVLDVDGVLVVPPKWYGVQLREASPVAAEAFFSGPFLNAQTGRIDLAQHLGDLLAALGRTCSPEAFLREWHDFENHPNRPVIEEVRSLRRAGWPVYLATNQERHRLQHLLEVVGLGEVVDGEFASCSVGYRKPDPAYYSEVTRRLGVAPEGIRFFDDTPANVDAALAAGWSAHLFRDVEDLRRAMRA